MDVDVKREIVAVITLAPESVAGGVPIFLAKDKEERDQLASSLSVILRGAVHDLNNGTLVLVKH